MRARRLDEAAVALLAHQRGQPRLLRNCPQVVIAGNPEHPCKAACQLGEGKAHVLEPLADIAGQDQPVVAIVRQREERLAVGRAGEMQVADGAEFHAGALPGTMFGIVP